jgi:hypothetical protein
MGALVGMRHNEILKTVFPFINAQKMLKIETILGIGNAI